MYRKFIALIVGTAIAVTGASASARADSQDLAKVLFGVAALAMIGKAIEDRKDRKEQEQAAQQTYQPPYHAQPNYPQPTYPRPTYPRPTYSQGHGYPIPPRPMPPQVSRYDLPGQCIRTYTVNRTYLRLLGSDCLRQSYRYSGALPEACKFHFRDHTGSHTGYEPVCLRDRGYRIARS